MTVCKKRFPTKFNLILKKLNSNKSLKYQIIRYRGFKIFSTKNKHSNQHNCSSFFETVGRVLHVSVTSYRIYLRMIYYDISTLFIFNKKICKSRDSVTGETFPTPLSQRWIFMTNKLKSLSFYQHKTCQVLGESMNIFQI